MFTIRTFGHVGLHAAPNAERVLGAGKPLALLIYLALAPGRRASRETLIDLLWADLEPERARNALRQAVFHLRRLLGEHNLAGTEELSLGAGIRNDRDDFLAALERDDLAGAIDLYAGAFLPDFGVPGGSAFEHWADFERGRLQTSFLRAAELLVRRHLNRSDGKSASRIARLVRDRARDDEAAWRLVLEAAIGARDFVHAGVEANALEEWAASEEVTLDAATRAALARARQINPSEPDAGEDDDARRLGAELTGREREFFAITSAFDAVRAGGSRHLHISAPAGLGKTRLLRDAMARLASTGAAIVHLRARPGDRDLPFAFAADLAAALAACPGGAGAAPGSIATLLALNPALSTWLSGTVEVAPAHEALRRRIHALADLIRAVADESPFLLAIDDAHWIDGPSLRVIEGFLPRIEDAPVLCVTTGRPDASIATGRTATLALAPLTVEQVGSLIEALGTLPVDESWTAGFAEGLHQSTRGSPLLLLETLHLAIEREALRLDRQRWQCVDVSRLRVLLSAGEALRERVRALSGDTRAVMLVLSLAGIPLRDGELQGVTGLSVEAVAAAASALEQQGFVTRAAGAWAPAHDEIAAAARDASSVTERTAIERGIGEHLARAGGGDLQMLFRAGRHLIAGGSPPALRTAFASYARLARRGRDRRSFRELAFEFAGDDPTLAATLAEAIPVTWRLGLWSPARVRAASAVCLLAPAVAGLVAWKRAARDEGAQRLVVAGAAGRVSAVVARDAEWDGRGDAAPRDRFASPIAARVYAHPEFPPAISPDGRSAAWIEDSGDSTTLDIWIRTPNGTRRLTRAKGDDVAHDWLPDGSALVGASSRWAPPGVGGDYDIAVYDTATGAARQVTRGRAHDTAPHASPDGTRIAFQREPKSGPPQLCVVPVDGSSDAECRLVGSRGIAQLLGWSSATELAIVVDAEDRRPLVIYDWRRDRAEEILGPQVSRAQLSPDRRWLVASLRREGIGGTRDWIIPVDHTNRARPVERAGDDEAGLVRWWEGPADQSSLIDRLELTGTGRVLSLGVGTRLEVHAFNRAGGETPIYARVAWTSSDPAIASVDSLGEVEPRKPGTATITAALPGWRHVSQAVQVGGATAASVAAERWDAGWHTRWIAWGDPVPTVAIGPGTVPALANNGDGTYPSVVVSRRDFDARGGLGLEVRVSTPLTNGPHQRLRTGWVAAIDTAALLAADQRGAPPGFERNDPRCVTTFPESGEWGATRLSTLGAIAVTRDLGETGKRLRRGAWWTLRIQIFPDGRCGVAVDGQVVSLSPEPILLDRPFRIRLGDESVDTRLLHGPLDVWTGVRTDIDWSRPFR